MTTATDTIPPHAKPASSPASQIEGLDGLRGIAVLMVILLHAGIWGGFHSSSIDSVQQLAIRATGIGWAGVDLFFVISGFLITGILLDTRNGPFRLRNFYARRALRIFPLYYSFLLFRFVVAPAHPDLLGNAGVVPPIAASQAVSYSFFLSNWWDVFHSQSRLEILMSPLWSLAVEEQFYLTWPFVVWHASRRGLLAVCCAIVVGAAVARAACDLSAIGLEASYKLTPCRFDALAIGATLAIAQRTVGLERTLAPGLGIVFLLSMSIVVLLSHGFPTLAATLAYTALDAFFGVTLALLVSDRESLISSVCRMRWLSLVGRYSYAMYILHVPIILALNYVAMRWLRPIGIGDPHVLLRYTVFTAAVIAAAYAAAWLSWHVIEKRCLALKRYFPR